MKGSDKIKEFPETFNALEKRVESLEEAVKVLKQILITLKENKDK